MSCRGALRRVGGADLGRRAAQKMMKEQALNATILSSSAYSVVEKVILLKSCKVFESATDQALAELAELVKMIRLPPGVLLYKEGAPGYDSFVIASGQVKLTKNGRLIGAWPADDACGGRVWWGVAARGCALPSRRCTPRRHLCFHVFFVIH
eukprot:SAG25_NODE_2523_length_1554_cov_1.422680_3_plen_152_part_00